MDTSQRIYQAEVSDFDVVAHQKQVARLDIQVFAG